MAQTENERNLEHITKSISSLVSVRYEMKNLEGLWNTYSTSTIAFILNRVNIKIEANFGGLYYQPTTKDELISVMKTMNINLSTLITHSCTYTKRVMYERILRKKVHRDLATYITTFLA
jgi:hypothetical protein